MFTYFACNFLILYIVIYKQLCYNVTIINKGVFNMQVSKYLYKHFAQLNCHNLNYGVKITSAVLLQFVFATFAINKHTLFYLFVGKFLP